MKKLLTAMLLGASMLLTVSAEARPRQNQWNHRSYCRAYPRAPECRRNGQWRGGNSYCFRFPFVAICTRADVASADDMQQFDDAQNYETDMDQNQVDFQ